MTANNRPQFPLYIPTKGRFDTMLTSRALCEMAQPHTLVVEPQEIELYQRAAHGTIASVLPLDMRYKARYDTCDDLGLSKSTGPGPARNFIWDHSIEQGHAWHWVMDDNIKYFARMQRNNRIKTVSPAIFRAMEDFCLRYMNVGMAGPAYTMFGFCEHMSRLPPFVLNTRIYSCNLIRNDIPFRWRGRYNEDTILSLDMLKAKWCTVQFNAFLQNKVRTQTIAGGNTDEFYAKEGTLAKSAMQQKVHPDVSRVVWKFKRWHHQVDYTPFKKTKLIRKPDVQISSTRNEYGMKVKRAT